MNKTIIPIIVFALTSLTGIGVLAFSYNYSNLNLPEIFYTIDADGNCIGSDCDAYYGGDAYDNCNGPNCDNTDDNSTDDHGDCRCIDKWTHCPADEPNCDYCSGWCGCNAGTDPDAAGCPPCDHEDKKIKLSGQAYCQDGNGPKYPIQGATIHIYENETTSNADKTTDGDGNYSSDEFERDDIGVAVRYVSVGNGSLSTGQPYSLMVGPSPINCDGNAICSDYGADNQCGTNSYEQCGLSNEDNPGFDFKFTNCTPQPISCVQLDTSSELSPGGTADFQCTSQGDLATYANFQLMQGDTQRASISNVPILNNIASWNDVELPSSPGDYLFQCQVCGEKNLAYDGSFEAGSKPTSYELSINENVTADDAPDGSRYIKLQLTGNDPNNWGYGFGYTWQDNPAIGDLAEKRFRLSYYIKGDTAFSVSSPGFQTAATGDSCSRSPFSGNCWFSGGAVNVTTEWTHHSYEIEIPNDVTESVTFNIVLKAPRSRDIVYYDGIKLVEIGTDKCTTWGDNQEITIQ